MNGHYLFLLSLFFMLSHNISLCSSTNSTDQQSLLAFKNLVTNNYLLTTNWTKNTSICNWVGVTCSSSERVISLNLANSNLDGKISPSLSNLSSLITLNLSQNNFGGTIPIGIGQLRELKTIDLGDNQLEGNIPQSLFQNQYLETIILAMNRFTGNFGESPWNLPQLKTLNITSNNLTGTINNPCIGNLSRIEKLIFSGNGFVGEIPKGIGNLSTLTEIDLSNNQFSGPIPSSIFSISSLQILYLSDNHLSGAFVLDGDNYSNLIEDIDFSGNQLSGNIPSNLCKFLNLAFLFLSRNNLTGEIPRNIGCLTKLKRFYITNNQISGSIPPSFGNISSLEFIGCVENSIGGEIPKELETLSKLKMLGFDYNNLSGEIPEKVFNISSLIYIAFTANKLSGKIPSNTGLWLPNLEGIFLADNQITGEFPYSISNASNLVELELSYNSFSGSVPKNLGNLRQLQFLNLAANKLMNEPRKNELDFFDSLVECRFLQFVILGNNFLNGTLPNSICNLTSSIEMFNIEDAGIRGEIPKGIGNLSGLLSLVLDGNDLVGPIPSEIGTLKQLQRLYLNRNNLQGSIPREICDLTDLGEILFFENNLSRTIPDCIGNLSRLQRLMLGSNKLDSTIPLSLWEIKSLLQVNFARNSLQGVFPTDLGNMLVIDTIDFSFNRFSGEIPSSIGYLTSLRNLSLSNNSFTGPIPSSFGNLISLENLDLSSNLFLGTIPKSLEKLAYLKSINVSYNDLQGEIPNGGAFASFPATSFMGNKDLCGFSQFQVPSCSSKKTKKSPFKNIILKIIIPIISSLMLLTAVVAILWLRCYRKKKKNSHPTVEKIEIKSHQTLSYYELQQATNNFNESNLLGVGSFGSVYKGILSDSTFVAVKFFNLNHQGAYKSFDIECEVLRSIRHRNLVKVITTCSNLEVRALVLEYMPNGSLENLLHKGEFKLDFVGRIDIMIDVAMAVEYLHHGIEEAIVHCDLKPSNVLLDEEMVAHVADFGISKILAENRINIQTRTLGTIGYIAPEYGSQGIVSACGDVYSYGIMLMETFTKKKPTDEMFSENWSLKQWVKASYPNAILEIIDMNMFEVEEQGIMSSFHKDCLSSLIGLALDCSMDAPDDRISMEDVVIRLKKIKQTLFQTKKVVS